MMLLLSCASIKEMNRPEEPNIVSFKKVVIIDNNGERIEGKDARIIKDAATIQFHRDRDALNYNLADIDSLSCYSGHGDRGVVIGGICGLLATLPFQDNFDFSSNGGDTFSISFNISKFFMMVGIITGMGIGHKIGSDYLGKWQSFDLGPYKKGTKPAGCEILHEQRNRNPAPKKE